MKGNNVLMPTILFTGLALFQMTSCNMARKYEKEEKEAIQKYLTDNQALDFERKSSGLYYLDILVGQGIQPVTGDSVFVKYTGSFLNGVVFDTNVGKNITLAFPLLAGEVIPGLDEGISFMKEGGKAKLLVPSSLAYGTTGYYTIPGYTPLIFDLELVQVKKGPF